MADIAKQSTELTLSINSGKIKGKLYNVGKGYISRQFLGIPYAQPPVGELRFSPPQPVVPWSDVLEATSYPAFCPQSPLPWPLNSVTEGLSMSEDCLYLNVHSPSTSNASSKLPVMVFIHGGGFVAGNAPADNTPSILSSFHDVIVVTIQYRLGVIGFLNIPGTQTTGNYGLMDQIEALKWVQTNVAIFGGDPSNVTIFGESAGGASAALLMLMPQTENLFHRVIAQSCAADSFHNCIRVEDSKQVSGFLGFLDCQLDDNYLTCLRSKSYSEILQAQAKLMSPENIPKFGNPVIINPVVDGVYIKDVPRNLLREGKFHKVPSIFGVTSNEGGLVPTFGQLPLQMFSPEFFQQFVAMTRNTPEGDNEMVRAAILYQYTKYGVPQTPELIVQQFMEYFGDQFITAPTVLNLEALANAGIPCYFYLFSHRSKYSVWPEWVGVNHGDDLPYMFGSPFNTPPIHPFATGFTDREQDLSRFMMKLWTNFAKFGTPNSNEEDQEQVTWPKFTTDNPAYLEICLERKIGKNYRAKEMAFWNEFLPKLATPSDKKEKSEGQKDEL